MSELDRYFTLFTLIGPTRPTRSHIAPRSVHRSVSVISEAVSIVPRDYFPLSGRGRGDQNLGTNSSALPAAGWPAPPRASQTEEPHPSIRSRTMDVPAALASISMASSCRAEVEVHGARNTAARESEA